MKIWKVKIKDKKETRIESYWGEAIDCFHAGECALSKAVEEDIEEPWVDEVVCFGEKRF